ncbi:hypothetical protein Tco_1238721, partial [Tanacetum coccineum]
DDGEGGDDEVKVVTVVARCVALAGGDNGRRCGGCGVGVGDGGEKVAAVVAESARIWPEKGIGAENKSKEGDV